MPSRKVRTNLSKKNPYYIDMKRRMELKWFCLQYDDWKRYLSSIRVGNNQDEWSDPTGEEAVTRIIFEEKIRIVEKAARDAGGDIYEYLLKAVTEDLSYVNLNCMYNIPCGRDYYYERFHKFWYLLSQEKHMF